LIPFEILYLYSIDAVSDRDFILEFLSTNAITAIHLSRLGEEWVLWSSEEFGFLVSNEKITPGGNMMPQRNNPDPMELVRGKTARVVGDLVTLLVLCKGLPHAYNHDLQVNFGRIIFFPCYSDTVQVIVDSSLQYIYWIIDIFPWKDRKSILMVFHL
jgi:argininosuccinate lyase